MVICDSPGPAAYTLGMKEGDVTATAPLGRAQLEGPAPRELAIRSTHDFVLRVATEVSPPTSDTSVLDVGAGQGSLTLKLLRAGYRVQACDLVPEQFAVPEVDCSKIDADGEFPYPDASFDLVCAVELVEHIQAHGRFFREVARVLKPGGKFLFTTPNILSLKSRWLFLWTGYPYSFEPLDPEECDPVSQHISALNLDQYTWHLRQAGLTLTDHITDKHQTTSRVLSPLIPVIRALSWWRYRGRLSTPRQNSITALLGRKLILVATR
jgi:SAM-dependent methyltransferase